MYRIHHDLFNIDDIRIEIMLRLPLKSLFKFRSVNKSWLATIDSSSFRKLHVQYQLSKNSFGDNEDSNYLQFSYSSKHFKKFKELSILFLDSGKFYSNFAWYEDFIKKNITSRLSPRFSRPVHGLICLYEKILLNPIALCNPFLQEIKILPPSPCPGSHNRVVGLGYDDVEKDYKVVQLWYDCSQKTNIVEVYSRKENAWRVLADHPFHKEYYISKPIQNAESSSKRSAAMVHFTGSRIWHPIEGGASKLDKVIVSFDVRSETSETIEFPPFKGTEIIEIFAKDDSFIMLTLPITEADVRQNGDLIMWEYKKDWVKVWSFSPPLDSWVWPEATWKSNRGLILTV